VESTNRTPSLTPATELAHHFGTMEAMSTSMREVFTLLSRLAPTEIAITLMGETGTGKGVLARAIHAASARADAPFVVFDCGAVPPNLVESELFGHEGGAFAGAMNNHAGVVERANGGTLFLDEVGELPLELQSRLRRVLEERSLRRVGGSVDRPIDLRIIAATNRDLKLRIAKDLFREELYFRLAAALVALPPLRARPEDLPVIVPQLLEELGQPNVNVDPAVFEALAGQSWPGNVRQLKNALACALTFVDEGLLEASHLKLSTPHLDETDLDRLPLGGLPLASIERAAIRQTLALNGGMKARAARALGIAISTLYDKLKKYDL
jgi:transcriptional regulator with PAS, ATPase and Fis domain